MEEQYGERYIMKLEERLLHYLEELNKALPQPTYIDQVRPCACVCHRCEHLICVLVCFLM